MASARPATSAIANAIQVTWSVVQSDSVSEAKFAVNAGQIADGAGRTNTGTP